jgi:hypothetical protein
MPEVTLPQYLAQIDHALDGMVEPKSPERDAEIASIRKRVRTYLEGISRVDTKQMKMAIIAGLEEIGPRVDALATTAKI